MWLGDIRTNDKLVNILIVPISEYTFYSGSSSSSASAKYVDISVNTRCSYIPSQSFGFSLKLCTIKY